MKRNIGIAFFILFMTVFLGILGCSNREELERQIFETKEKIALAEERAVKAENLVRDLEYRRKVAKDYASVCGVKQ